MKETLNSWLEEIKNETPYINIKPYSHNIISLALKAIAKNFGDDKAQKAIKNFGLDKLGWKSMTKL